MEETKVGFETAKSAKEKGFNWKVEHYIYDEFDKQTTLKDTPTDYSNFKKGILYECISQPTQSLLQKWLREVHNIIVEVVAYYDEEQLPLNKPVKPKGYFAWDYYDDIFTEDKAIKTETYEEALEIGLQEGLKQIKNGSTN